MENLKKNLNKYWDSQCPHQVGNSKNNQMKKLLILIVPVLFLFSCKQDPGEIRGVVTCLFNDNVGYKPDVGALIYVTKINCDSLILSYKGIEEFKQASAILDRCLDFYGYSKAEQERSEKQEKQAMEKAVNVFYQKYNGEKGYLKLLARGKDIFETIQQDKETLKAQVDASGNYIIPQVNPSEYTVIICSSITTDRSIPKIEKVQVESKKTITVNARFY